MTHLILLAAFAGDLRDLGSPDFAARQRAEERLSRYADWTWPLCDVGSADAEVRRRSRRVVAAALPQSFSPLPLLLGAPLAEWRSAEGRDCVGWRPGPGSYLTWTRMPPRRTLADALVWHYTERARTQSLWKDWVTADDGREATRLLVEDLKALGVPPALLRALCGELARREGALHAARGAP